MERCARALDGNPTVGVARLADDDNRLDEGCDCRDERPAEHEVEHAKPDFAGVEVVDAETQQSVHAAVGANERVECRPCDLSPFGTKPPAEGVQLVERERSGTGFDGTVLLGGHAQHLCALLLGEP